MGNQLVTPADMDFFAQQSAGNLNMIISGMTALMKDTDNKVSQLEDQTWFQRMSNTITGKNKMTLDEIQQNHEQINMYMTEALSELYNRNMMDHQIMIGLGNQINEVYAEQIQLKEMLGAFVSKLNEKIISIDNFHMLVEEINHNVFSDMPTIVAVSMIISQIDLRTAKDQRKMEILTRSLSQSGIVNDKGEKLVDILEELLSVSESDAGLISMFLMGVQNDYLSEIISGALYEYYGMPERIRRFKNKRSVVENYLKNKQIDDSMVVSTQEIYASIIEAYANSMIDYAMLEDNKGKREEVNKYFQTINTFLERLLWAMDMSSDRHDEYTTLTKIKNYYNYMSNVNQQIQLNAFIGNVIQKNSYNIECFFKELFESFPEIFEEGIFYQFGQWVKISNGVVQLPDSKCADKDGIIEGYSLWSAIKELFLDKFSEKYSIIEEMYSSLSDRSKDIIYDWDEDLIEHITRDNDDFSLLFDTYLQFKEASYFDYDIHKSVSGTIINDFRCFYSDYIMNMLNAGGGELGSKTYTVDWNGVYELSKKYPVEFPKDMFEKCFERSINKPKIYVLTTVFNLDRISDEISYVTDYSAGYVSALSKDVYVFVDGNTTEKLYFQEIQNSNENGEKYYNFKWDGIENSMNGYPLYKIHAERINEGEAIIKIYLDNDSKCRTYVHF